MVEKVEIERIDTERLEKSWFNMSALQDLIKNDITNDIIISKYQEAYKIYNQIWSELLLKYFKTDYTQMPGYNWTCDFSTNTIIITE